MKSEPAASSFGPFFDLTAHFPRGVFAYFLLKGNSGAAPETVAAFLASRGHEAIKVHRADQVHSATVVHADKTPCEADAIIVTSPGEAARVVTADCVPILMASPGGRAAAVHAGWRGTLANISARALEALGAKPSSVSAYIGPAIGPCCYAVDEGRHRAFQEAFPEIVPRHVSEEPLRLDLSAINAALLMKAGVPRENIFREARCTSCDDALCCSYRRDGERAGRMVAVIGLERRREVPCPR